MKKMLGEGGDMRIQMNAARRLRRETLGRQAKSGHLAVERQSTWGMSDNRSEQ
jgi:hypothetical protein